MSSKQPKWWETSVIYQVYPRSFMDSNSDGVGDLRGIASKLDYLKWLGIDVVWLSPIYPSPMADFGYDISNYTDVEPMFGTLADFEDLLEGAHQRGLKLILDLVPNHTSDEHPWFQESRSSRDNPKRDWYIWHAGKNNGPPNNWQSQFGNSAWQFDETTGQYYLHSFDVKQVDLNWRNPEVRKAIYDVMRFWLDKGVDGFRVDVMERLIKDAQFRDNPLNPVWKEGDPEYTRYLEEYSNDQPEVHEIVREMRQVIEEYSDRVLIGEIYLPYPQLMKYYGPNLEEAHLPFNFKLIQLEQWQAKTVAEIVDEYESGLPSGAWPNWVMSNHDRRRMVSRVGTTQARVAQMLLLTLRGTPTCYYGDEIGMQDVPISPEKTYDPLGKFAPELNRDPVRTPMQWDASPNGGFCPADVTPWLPLADDYQEFNVAKEQQRPNSPLVLVRQLLELRKAHPALNSGDYQAVENQNTDCLTFIRQADNEKFLIALNFSDQPQTLSLQNFGTGVTALSTFLDTEGTVDLAELTLRGGEGLLIELRG